jgi:hypothetical protein
MLLGRGFTTGYGYGSLNMAPRVAGAGRRRFRLVADKPLVQFSDPCLKCTV